MPPSETPSLFYFAQALCSSKIARWHGRFASVICTKFPLDKSIWRRLKAESNKWNSVFNCLFSGNFLQMYSKFFLYNHDPHPAPLDQPPLRSLSLLPHFSFLLFLSLPLLQPLIPITVACVFMSADRPISWNIMDSLPRATLQHKMDPLPSSHLMFLI